MLLECIVEDIPLYLAKKAEARFPGLFIFDGGHVRLHVPRRTVEEARRISVAKRQTPLKASTCLCGLCCSSTLTCDRSMIGYGGVRGYMLLSDANRPRSPSGRV